VDDQTAALAADGAVCVRQLVGADLIRDVTAAVDSNLADLSSLAIVMGGGAGGRFVEDFYNWPRFGAYVELARVVAPTVADLMGSRQVRLYHDHLLVKEAGTQTRTPWHQDQPYYDMEGRDVISMWVPVDPVPRAATLEFLAGSHLGPWLMPRTFLDTQAKWFPPGSLAEVPDIDADRAALRILGWALEPGDVVFFHALTLHSSAGTDQRRRVLSLRFLGDDARRVERAWPTSPPLPADAEFPLLVGAV
jgi:ectoine hydroxylase-related dioxygenase (phytanoyl-CoA dioxygenase family)